MYYHTEIKITDLNILIPCKISRKEISVIRRDFSKWNNSRSLIKNYRGNIRQRGLDSILPFILSVLRSENLKLIF